MQNRDNHGSIPIAGFFASTQLSTPDIIILILVQDCSFAALTLLAQVAWKQLVHPIISSGAEAR